MQLELVAALKGSSAGQYGGLGLWVFGAHNNGWAFWRYAEGAWPGVTLDAVTGQHDGDGQHRSLTGPVSDLDEAVGQDWVWFIPGSLHPEVVGWFRERFEQACVDSELTGPSGRLLRPTWESRLGLA
jgi:hypothetical protein